MEELVGEGAIFRICTVKDPSQAVLFYNWHQQPNILSPKNDTCSLLSEFKSMWHQISVPFSEDDLEKELDRAGLKKMSVIEQSASEQQVLKNQHCTGMGMDLNPREITFHMI